MKIAKKLTNFLVFPNFSNFWSSEDYICGILEAFWISLNDYLRKRAKNYQNRPVARTPRLVPVRATVDYVI